VYFTSSYYGTVHERTKYKVAVGDVGFCLKVRNNCHHPPPDHQHPDNAHLIRHTEFGDNIIELFSWLLLFVLSVALYVTFLRSTV